MDKYQLLRVADGVRKERFSRSTQGMARCGVGSQQSVAARFLELAKELTKAERLNLLHSLKASLEKERRRCLGRKHNYDPGRHISLYIAIKTLTSFAKKPPE